MKNLKLRVRLGLAFATIMLLMLVVSVAGITRLAEQNKGTDEIAETIYPKARAAQQLSYRVMDIARLIRNLILVENDALAANKASFDKDRELVAEQLEFLKKTASTPEEKRLIGVVDTAGAAYMQYSLGVVQLALDGRKQEATAELYGERYKSQAAFLAALQELVKGQEARMDEATARIESGYAQAFGITVGITLAAAAISLLLAYLITVSITKPVGVALSLAQAVSRGDLSQQVSTEGKPGARDEIGTLVLALGSMQNQLREMILEIKSGSNQLLQMANAVAGTSDTLSSVARDQSQSAGSMAAAVEELTVSIAHVASNASEAHDISASAGRQSLEGGEVLKRTLGSVEQIAVTVRGSSADVDELGRSIDEISSIVSVIKSIADQTNLLALNAAIEAARAGEHGPGFAVVADEVRQLAQRTASSTHEIGQMIAKVQASTKRVVVQMGVGLEQANNGLGLAQSAGSVIEEIRSGSSRILSAVDQISAALQEQSSASQDVARSVERIAQMSQTTSDAIDGVSGSAVSIKDLAHSLEQQVARFKL